MQTQYQKEYGLKNREKINKRNRDNYYKIMNDPILKEKYSKHRLEYQREYYKKNNEKMLEWQHNWRKDHPEIVKQYTKRAYSKIDKVKRNEYGRKYYQIYKEKRSEQGKKKYRKDIEKSRQYGKDRWIRRLNKKYNIDYNKLVIEQENKCAICKQELKLYVDHCHEKNLFRGLLCRDCNTSIGLLKNDVLYLKNAIEYLTRFTSQTPKD